MGSCPTFVSRRPMRNTTKEGLRRKMATNLEQPPTRRSVEGAVVGKASTEEK